MPSRFLSLDPGLAAGWAVWNWPGRLPEPPLAVGLIEPRRIGDEWWTRAQQGVVLFRHALRVWKPQFVVSEFPEFYDDPGGHMCAATGDLQKLTFAVGAFAAVAFAEGVRYHPIKVSTWKGQLPKEVVNKRILKRLGEKACANFERHVWDAVGIGLFWKGALKGSQS